MTSKNEPQDASKVPDGIAAFELRLAEDKALGSLRPLLEYIAEFPGHDFMIAERYADSLNSEEPASTLLDERTKFGSYSVLEEIGRGGFGVVYLAEDNRLRRKVALKVLQPSRNSTTMRMRFAREAESASKISDPGVCRIHEIGEDGNSVFIAMEHITGHPLDQLIAESKAAGCAVVDLPAVDLLSSSNSPSDGSRRRLNPTHRALELVERIAVALQAAHDVGIVHRDVKPGNVIVQPNGRPVLIDFGLAHVAQASLALTGTQDQLGTPAYMAPELISDSRFVDGRSDVFSLGVILFECLTGRRPFEATTVAGLQRAILEERAIDPRVLNPNLSLDISSILRMALETDPRHRYASAVDFALDLNNARLAKPVLARPLGPLTRTWRWGKKKPFMALSLLLLLLVALVPLELARRERLLTTIERENSRKEEHRRKYTETLLLVEKARSFTGSESLATCVDADARFRRLDMDPGETTRTLAYTKWMESRVSSFHMGAFVDLSQDNKSLWKVAVGRSSNIIFFDDLGNQWKPITKKEWSGCQMGSHHKVALTWTPNGTAYIWAPSIRQCIGKLTNVHLASISPDERSLIVLGKNGLVRNLRLPTRNVQLDIDANDPRIATETSKNVIWEDDLGDSGSWRMCMSPDGSTIVVLKSIKGKKCQCHVFESRTGKRSDWAELDLEATSADWMLNSADEPRIAVGDAAGKVHLISVSSGDIKNSILHSEGAHLRSVAWSPDGKWMVSTADPIVTKDKFCGPGLVVWRREESRYVKTKFCEGAHSPRMVQQANFSPNSQWFTTAGRDAKLILWKIIGDGEINKEAELTVTRHSKTIWDSTSSRFWSLAGRGIQQIDVSPQSEHAAANQHNEVVTTAFRPVQGSSDVLIATASGRVSIRPCEVRDNQIKMGAVEASFELKKRITKAIWSKDGNVVFLGTDKGEILRWRCKNEDAEFIGNIGEGSIIELIARKDWLVSLSRLDQVRQVNAWRLRSNRIVSTPLDVPSGFVTNCVAVDHEGEKLALGGRGGKVLQYALDNDTRLTVLSSWKVNDPEVNSLAWNEDGSRIAVAGDKGSVWSIKDEGEIKLGPGSTLERLEWTVNGDIMGMNIWGNEVLIYPATSNEPSVIVGERGNLSSCLSISANRKFGARGTWDGTLNIIDLSKRKSQAFVELGSKITSIDFSPNAEILIVGTKKGRVQVLPLAILRYIKKVVPPKLIEAYSNLKFGPG
ncbi:MAG: serine/threonine protein kinase/WD40 repeat protein [Planctomycetota bacterium]|jgi:serine/threonine protein kinase/WD40 repeat protein